MTILEERARSFFELKTGNWKLTTLLLHFSMTRQMLETVRLDVWLDIACLFKTRSEAQRACRVGRVSVNGAVAKPHRELRPGDEVVVNRPAGRRQTIVVRALADRHVAKAEARALYEDRTPPPTAEHVEMRRMERLFKASTGATRLDRKDRRDVARRKFTT